MKKLLRALILGTVLSVTSAFAALSQTANSFNTGVMTSISADAVSEMLAGYGITTQLLTDESGVPFMIASTDGGAKFLITLRQCQGSAAAVGCLQATITTAQPSSGVTFDDINRFNGSSNVTTMAYDQSNQIVIFGRNIFMPGGVGVDNFKLQIVLFLSDMNNYIKTRQTVGTAVSFNRAPSLQDKVRSITAQSDDAVPFQMSDNGALEVKIAIENAGGVDFSFDENGND